MRTIEELLAQHPFFMDLQPDYIELAAGCARNVAFKQGEYIFKEGKDANDFFLIKSGTIALQMEVPSRPPVTIETIAEGDILGWSWLVPPYRWLYDACAMETTRAIALDGKCLRTKCEENHDLGYELFKRVMVIMEHRLQAARLQMMDVYGVTA